MHSTLQPAQHSTSSTSLTVPRLRASVAQSIRCARTILPFPLQNTEDKCYRHAADVFEGEGPPLKPPDGCNRKTILLRPGIKLLCRKPTNWAYSYLSPARLWRGATAGCKSKKAVLVSQSLGDAEVKFMTCANRGDTSLPHGLVQRLQTRVRAAIFHRRALRA